MRPRNVRQLLLATIGGLVVVGLLLALASYFSAPGGAPGTVGWMLPVASVFVIVGVIWLLASQSPRSSNRSTVSDYTMCKSCGRQVLPDWRLCPYCGSMLEEPSEDARTSAVHDEGSLSERPNSA
jgi:hypothetical protein